MSAANRIIDVGQVAQLVGASNVQNLSKQDTSRQAEMDRNPAGTATEDAVAAYLAAHPEFFERRPDLVAELRVPHSSGHAVSLIEYQVEVLRGQLRTERQRLAQLIARAQDFEALSARLHSLFLELIASRNLEQVEAVLRGALCRQFDTEAVTLRLFPLESDGADSDPTVAAFVQFLNREHSVCGPLDVEHNGMLFGEQDKGIGSVALIPVRTDDHSGVLAIGSHDPERFSTDLGTDHLDRLGEVIGQKLRSLHQADG